MRALLDRGLTRPQVLLVDLDDELLTTGEAAKLLDCSLQHVVDLCKNEDLPFTSVGR
jgi:hypothetical protein